MNQQTVSGPTQTARAGAAAEWSPRPVVAAVLRLTILLFPYIVAMLAALAISQWWSADRSGLHPILWWVLIALGSTLVMIPADRFIRGLIPISSLLTVALEFPDAAPSRFRAAMRSSTTAQVKRRVGRAVENSANGEFVDRSQYMLDLVSLLTVHDRMTRGHSERVRAYSSLLGDELRLSKEEQQKLYWAALLHDIGKLDVPAEILNKSTRPSKAEWGTLQTHPAAAVKYLEPLRGWLGPWASAADEHHLRWDGKGYPKSIGGTDISLAGRIVAVADAYDVMTSARSYKAGMDPADARIELSACAGGQFDPTVVRAFLNIGLNRLRLTAGPLASLPVLIGSLLTGAATTGGKVLLATSAVATGVAASPPVEPPFIPAVLAYVDDASDWLMPEAEPPVARANWQRGDLIPETVTMPAVPDHSATVALAPDEQLPPEVVPAGTPLAATTAAGPTPTAIEVVTVAPAVLVPSPDPQPTADPDRIPLPPAEKSSNNDDDATNNGNSNDNATNNGNGNGNSNDDATNNGNGNNGNGNDDATNGNGNGNSNDDATNNGNGNGNGNSNDDATNNGNGNNGNGHSIVDRGNNWNGKGD